MARVAPVPERTAHGHRVTGPAREDPVMDELLLRELTPAVIGVLVHRGVDFATAEDAVQEALIQAALTGPDRKPADPKGWLVTVAWRKFLDARRSEVSRRDREQRVEAQPPPGPTEAAD